MSYDSIKSKIKTEHIKIIKINVSHSLLIHSIFQEKPLIYGRKTLPHITSHHTEDCVCKNQHFTQCVKIVKPSLE